MHIRTCALLSLLAVIAAALPTSADRLILSPTGSVLGRGDLRAEGLFNANSNDPQVYQLNFGLERVELSAAWINHGSELIGSQNTDSYGVELGILPETTLTPGIGVGIWDITASTADGRGYYLAITKVVPLTKMLPLPLNDVKLHLGVGAAGIDGPFGGADAALFRNVRLYGEYFQHNSNFAVGVHVFRGIEARACSLGGKPYYGVQISSILSQ